MSLVSFIESSKAGSLPFDKIGHPSKVCETDEDFIAYINYCFEVIAFNENKLKSMSVYSEDNCIELVSVSKDLLRAHAVIEHCHNYLSGKWKPVAKSSYEDYMHRMTREKTK